MMWKVRRAALASHLDDGQPEVPFIKTRQRRTKPGKEDVSSCEWTACEVLWTLQVESSGKLRTPDLGSVAESVPRTETWESTAGWRWSHEYGWDCADLTMRDDPRGQLYFGGSQRRPRKGHQRCGKKIRRMESQESREASWAGESDHKNETKN